MKRNVSEIRIEVVVDGVRASATYVRKEKIDLLLGALEPLGDHLRAMVENVGKRKAGSG